MEFKAQPRTIQDTLDLKRKYIIPRFQREYSWGPSELVALWDDLLDCYNYQHGKLIPMEYFIGSLVLIGDDDDSVNIERQVVDGQQRLITFTIAFSVLSQKFKEIKESKLADLVHRYIIGEDENGMCYTRVVSEAPRPFFQYRIQQKEINFNIKPTTLEEKHILKAYNFFNSKLSESSLLEDLKERYGDVNISYVDALKLFRDQILKCKVIYVTVSDFSDAYTIFEVLNAKGKGLEPIDIIKNTLFSIVDQTEPIDEADDHWKKIRRTVELDRSGGLSTFYRHFWLSRYGYTTNKKLVEKFNKTIEKNIYSYKNFIKGMSISASDYRKILTPRREDWNEIENQTIFETLEALNVFGVTQVRIILLALFNAHRNGVLKHKMLLKALNYLEYFHFVFTAICSKRPSNLESKYATYSKKLFMSKDNVEGAQHVKELIEVLQTMLPDYDQFENGFQKLYFIEGSTKHKKIIQYILKKLERYASETKELQPDFFTIEHIMPASSGVHEVGMIGNLIPLGESINGDADTKPFSYKLEKYQLSQYKVVQNFVKKYGAQDDWNISNIYDRTSELAKIMYFQNKVPKE